MPDDIPIAGVDLEAEQVIEEEAEKPVKVRRGKLRPAFMIFGAILVVEAIVLFMVFAKIGGGTPEDQVASADTGDAAMSGLDEATLLEMKDWGVLDIGDVSIFENSIDQPGRSVETTIVGLQVAISKQAWVHVQKIFSENPDAEKLIVMDLRDHVRKFMSMSGGEDLSHRQEVLDDDLLRYLLELKRDSVGGLSSHITTVGYEKVKSVLR